MTHFPSTRSRANHPSNAPSVPGDNRNIPISPPPYSIDGSMAQANPANVPGTGPDSLYLEVNFNDGDDELDYMYCSNLPRSVDREGYEVAINKVPRYGRHTYSRTLEKFGGGGSLKSAPNSYE